MWSLLATTLLILSSTGLSASKRQSPKDRNVRMARSLQFSAQRRSLFKVDDWQQKAECYTSDVSTCRELENGTTCLGAILPYNRSSTHHSEALFWGPEQLKSFEIFAGVPECWLPLRELLCIIYYPPCENGRVLLASRSLCEETRRKCHFLLEQDLWPTALGNCSNSPENVQLDALFTDNCSVVRPPRAITWNEQIECIHPLVPSKFEREWIINQCAINCTSMLIPLHEPMQCFVLVLLLVDILFSVISVIELKFDTVTDQFPRFAPCLRPLAWCLFSNLFSTGGWLIQLLFRTPAACLPDGSLQLHVPTTGSETPGVWCYIQFMLVIGGSIKMNSWLTMFSYRFYAWNRGKTGCFIPTYQTLIPFLVLIFAFVLQLATLQIGGDPLFGVCFLNTSTLLGALLYIVPVVLLSLISLVIVLIMFCCSSNKTKDGETDNLETSQSKLFYPSNMQVLLLILIVLTNLLVSGILLYEQRTFETRSRNIYKYVSCELKRRFMGDSSGTCHMMSLNDIRLGQFRLLLLCAPAVIVAVWLFVCCDVWRRCWRRCCCLLKRVRKTPVAEKNPVGNGKLNAIAPSSSFPNEETTSLIGPTPMMANGLRNRNSQGFIWGSSSSITDFAGVGEPGNISKLKQFKRTFGRKSRHALSHSTSSLAKYSSRTPSSLKSGPLPTELGTMPSVAELAFPDLSRYPIEAASANICQYAPWNWAMPPWAWFINYQPSPSYPGQPMPGMEQSMMTPPTSSKAHVQQGGPSSSATLAKQPMMWPQFLPLYPMHQMMFQPPTTASSAATAAAAAAAAPPPPPLHPASRVDSAPSTSSAVKKTEVTKTAKVESPKVPQPIEQRDDETTMKVEDETDDDECTSDDCTDSEEFDPEEEALVEEEMKFYHASCAPSLPAQ